MIQSAHLYRQEVTQHLRNPKRALQLLNRELQYSKAMDMYACTNCAVGVSEC